ncbi:MAG: LamG-like jellyroll fold domain-containing protein [Pirellulaceae bacterium]|nr:LamG-like jellyroll fold domain-containing protein [Pirellulaceae bacterium]
MVTNASINATAINEPSGAFSANLNGQPSNNDVFASMAIALQGASKVVLSYSFQQTGLGDSPEADEDLILEYSVDGKLASDGTKVWIEIDRQLGSAPDMQTFSKRAITLPNAALRNSFQFRFRSTGTANAAALDDWFIDDVSVTRTDGSAQLLAAVATQLGMPVTLSASLPGTSSIDLNGSTQFIQVPFDTTLNSSAIGDEFSVELWFRQQATSSTNQALISTRSDASERLGYALILSPTNQLQFYTGNGATGTSSAWDILNGPTITINAWTHVAATFDGISGPDANGAFTGLKSLYVNGVLVSSSTQKFQKNATLPLRIGADAPLGSNQFFFNGNIDEVRVWNLVLSSNTIEGQFKSTTSPSTTGLQGYWRLDELSGAVATDLTTPANNGTLTGAPPYTTETFAQLPIIHVPIYASQFASLVRLDANSKSISDLNGAEFLTNVRTLNLASNNLDETDIANLIPRRLATGNFAGELVGLGSLVSLDLTSNRNLRTIASLSNFKKLSSLKFEGTKIEVAAPATITTLSSFTELTTLNLPTGVLTASQNLVATEGTVVTIPYTLKAVELDGPNTGGANTDGTHDFIATTNAAALGFQSNFTASAWIRPRLTDTDRAIFGTDSSTTNQGLSFGIRNGFAFFSFTNNETTGTQAIPINTWTYVAYRFDSSTGQQAIFINGVLDTATTGHAAFAGNEIVNLGRAQSARNFKGRLDNVRVFNRVLSDAEIFANMEGSIPSNASDVTLDYRFYSSPAGIATDSSLNQFDGALVNSPIVVTVTDQAWTVTGVANASGTTTSVSFIPLDNGIANVRFKGDQFPVFVRNGIPTVLATPNLGLANSGAGVKEGQAIAMGTQRINGLSEYWNRGQGGSATIDPIDPGTNLSSLLASNPDLRFNLSSALSISDTTISARTGGIITDDDYSGVWLGKIVIGAGGSGAPLTAGTITLGTQSSDGSVIFVDVNNNGVFESGERIVNNNGVHAIQNAVGSVTLAAGSYSFVIGYFATTGSNFIEARFAQGTVSLANFGTMTVIDPSSASQNGLWLPMTDPVIELPILVGTGIPTTEVDKFKLSDSVIGDGQSLNAIVSVIAPDGSVSDLTARSRWFRDDLLTVPGAALNGASDVTTTFWIKTPKSQTHTVLSTLVQNELEISFTSTAITVIGQGITAVASKPVSAPDLTDNNFHHISVVRNASQRRIQVLVDGLVWGDISFNVPMDRLNIADNGLFIGQRVNSSTPTFTKGFAFIGRLDDLTIWDRALTFSEIEVVRQGEIDASDSGLRLWLPLNEPSGAIAADRGPLGLDGTFVPSYVATTLSNKPILYYLFTETNGSTTAFYDVTANGRNATIAGTGLLLNQTSATTSLSSALRFGNAGSSNSLIVPAIGNVPQLTIESWIQPSNYPPVNIPADFDAIYNTDSDPASVAGALHLQVTSAGQIRVTLGTLGSFTFGTSGILPLNQWTHLVVSYSSTTKDLNVFANGSLIGHVVTASSVVPNLTAARIGSWLGTLRQLDGLVDDFAIYDRVLSAAEVVSR